MYTLDPQDSEQMENCNDEQLERMQKYVDAVMDVMLTERQRQVVWMRHGEGKKTTEIAAALGISPRGVRGALAAGMRKISKHKKIFLKTV
jgi:RNA polymerase sigma factor (sigma-70 family)